jgi:hypothetical protein|tara:strand:- start:726 stop:947 length:222 start_codon:yes stop_codon:yes gene_type:complete
MADLTFQQYVRAQQRKADKVTECMHLQKLDKEMSPLTRKMLDKNVAYIIRNNRLLDQNHKHWTRWDKEYRLHG